MCACASVPLCVFPPAACAASIRSLFVSHAADSQEGREQRGFVNAGVILDGAFRRGRMTRQDERRDRGESAGSLSDSNMFEELY